MPEFHYESAEATVIILADNEDDADADFAEIVREPNVFDLIQQVE